MSIQQMLLAAGRGYEGAPQNQSGGINSTFQPNGTNTITSGVAATPANWMNVSPQPGVGSFFWIKVTDAGTGTAGAITGAAVSGFVTMNSVPVYSISTGLGTRNFTYQISSNAAGTSIVATGSGTLNNTI